MKGDAQTFRNKILDSQLVLEVWENIRPRDKNDPSELFEHVADHIRSRAREVLGEAKGEDMTRRHDGGTQKCNKPLGKRKYCLRIGKKIQTKDHMS